MEPQHLEESGERIIQEQVEIEATSTTYANYEATFSFEEFYDTAYLRGQMKKQTYTRVALQFPDELLKDAQKVTECLQHDFEGLVFTLGDTSYGGCCVDEVAAAHLNADLVIHFGPACLSAPSKIPTLYSFGRSPIDMEKLTDFTNDIVRENEKNGKKIYLAYDTCYHYLQDSIKQIEGIRVATLILDQEQEGEDSFRFHGRDFGEDPGLQESIIVFVGSQESKVLSNLSLSFSHKGEIKYFDPVQGSGNSSVVTKILMKRYMLTAKARDAETIGILVGTLSIKHFNEAIQRVKTLIKGADKSFYTMMVGKLNPAKVANFADIGVFVLIACPENSLVDTRDFYQDIITPFELELALNEDLQWEGRVLNDFSNILKLSSDAAKGEEENKQTDQEASRPGRDKDDDEDDEDNVYLSLVDGKIKRKKKNAALDAQFTDNQVSESSLVKVSDSKDIVMMENSDMWNKFKTKEYQGLDPAVGKSEVKKAVQGLTGIASSYESESKPSS